MRKTLFAVLLGVTMLNLAGSKEGTTELKVGDKAPAIKLTAQDGKVYDLKDYSGQWVAVYFYPKDNTPGCTKQACSVRDGLTDLKKAGITVFGISGDSLESHKKFASKYNLNFPLLADENKSIAKAYGASGLLGMAKRQTFIITPDQKIGAILAKVDVTDHADEIIKTVDELKAGGK